ncbi:RNA polymerase-binding transcription factor DksA [Abditibacterium utsteinense]|uniref:RNA polymerase-binding transcription factor DksA n=1 Tax=Abditibacterium utsteinense TaxID=1960156 RepID=A0A2S8SXM4_9BACT|nr:hypothetical protein [Abditibacterium utsteinense]PQV65544.1 RNA polymerase-binding transcription factor DksA [Abditibacterium utsteinense]
MPTNSSSDTVTPVVKPKIPRKPAAPKPVTSLETGGERETPTSAGATIESVNADSMGMKPQQRTDLDVEHYRQLLLDELSRLEEERDYVRKSNSDMDGNLPEDAEGDEDTTDLATSLMDKEMDLSVEEEIEETMAAIEHALRKMEDGTYGICDVSNQPIPKSRLELIPWASLTAQMQSMAEGE